MQGKRIRPWVLLMLLLIALVFAGIRAMQSGSSANGRDERLTVQPDQLHDGGIARYPYTAGRERRDHVLSGYTELAPGDSVDKVLRLLGKPDEILPLYEPRMYNPARIGQTYWYILRRIERRGSGWSDEALVRVALDDGMRIIQVDHWGLKEFEAAKDPLDD